MKIPGKNSSGAGNSTDRKPCAVPTHLVYEGQDNRRKERGMMGWLRKSAQTILLRAVLCRWTVF